MAAGDVLVSLGMFRWGARPMITNKRVFRVGPRWVLVLMALWGFAMIVPAALPH
jgi:hypothetical protein